VICQSSVSLVHGFLATFGNNGGLFDPVSKQIEFVGIRGLSPQPAVVIFYFFNHVPSVIVLISRLVVVLVIGVISIRFLDGPPVVLVGPDDLTPKIAFCVIQELLVYMIPVAMTHLPYPARSTISPRFLYFSQFPLSIIGVLQVTWRVIPVFHEKLAYFVIEIAPLVGSRTELMALFD